MDRYRGISSAEEVVEGTITAGPRPLSGKINLPTKQTTLSRPINCVGVGLHSGKRVSLCLKPAGPNDGIVFVRSDLSGKPEIKASWENVVDTRMCTTLGNSEGVTVSTVEHLMAALSGCHVDNVIVEVDGSEVPIMDGSAQPFVFLVECSGLEVLNVSRNIIEILRAVTVKSNGGIGELSPGTSFSIGFEIEFDNKAVSRQELQVDLVNGTFKKEIARARTFGFIHEVEALRASGLARGGNLDNAVVVDGDHILNDGGLRYTDEFVRHKVLDAVGDLYLAGSPILGHYRGVRAGHEVTNKLLQALFADPTAWRLVNLAGAQATLDDKGASKADKTSDSLVASA